MRNLSTKEEAALKKVKIENDLDIDDHAVEINILCELKHPNIVMLQETYFFQDKLWVGWFLMLQIFGHLDFN